MLRIKIARLRESVYDIGKLKERHPEAKTDKGLKSKLKYVLRDGPSYTGTFVDNEILGDRERRVIEDGTLFTIGATSIILRTADSEEEN